MVDECGVYFFPLRELASQKENYLPLARIVAPDCVYLSIPSHLGYSLLAMVVQCLGEGKKRGKENRSVTVC